RGRLNEAMSALPYGIRRLTFALPIGIDHVHCYLVPTTNGGWMVVDTALGLPGARERWAAELAGLHVERILVTHYHPDHVGGAADVAELTEAPVLESRLDHEHALDAWGNPGSRFSVP